MFYHPDSYIEFKLNLQFPLMLVQIHVELILGINLE